MNKMMRERKSKKHKMKEKVKETKKMIIKRKKKVKTAPRALFSMQATPLVAVVIPSLIILNKCLQGNPEQ